MLTLIICILICVVIRLKMEWYLIDGIGDFLGDMFIGAVLGFIIGVVVMVSLPMDREIKSYENEILTLQDNSGSGGDFFLGSGNFNGTMNYVYYYSVDGGFKMEQVDYKDAIIKYSNETKVIIYKDEVTDSWINWFGVDFLESDRYEIFVPKELSSLDLI